MPKIAITGVSTGIGRACANRFASAGWEVVGTVRDPSRARPEELAAAVRLEGVDLAVPGSAGALGERLVLDGCPDVLLNNAGIVQFGPLECIGADELVALYQVNLFSQLELIRSLLPAMRERGSGTIVNVTSLGGRMVFPFFAGYNSTKWALEGISEGLWHELRPFGIRVKAVEPGFVETAIWGKAMRDDGGDAVEAPDEYRTWMSRMAAFERSITSRTTPEASAEEIFAAVMDSSDRLRYPVAAYARPLVAARRWLGDAFMMRFFHERWIGDKSQRDS